MDDEPQPGEPARLAEGAGSAAAARPALAARLGGLIRAGEQAGARFVVASTSPLGGVLERAARVSRELKASFAAADTPIELSPGRVGALVQVDEGTDADLIRARIACRGIVGVTDAEVVALPLPRLLAEVAAFVDGL